MKKISFFILPLLIIFLGCQKAEVERPTYRVEKGDVSLKIALSGRAESSLQSVISAPFDISVKSLRVSTGQIISSSTILAELDTTTVTDKLREEKTKHIQIDTRITNGEIRVRGLQKELGRLERLVKAGAASVSEKEQKQSELQISNNEVEAIRREKDNLAENLRLIQQQINLLDIKAPFDGIITYVWISPDKFTAGISVKKGDVLFKVSSRGKMQIRTTCSEKEVNYFSQGQKVNILFPNLRNKSVPAEIVLVDHSATIDKESGIASFRMHVEFEPINDIKPGMEGIIEHQVEKRKNILKIPRLALRNGSEGYEVHVLNDGNVEIRRVRIGLIGDDDIEIQEGVKEGELLVVNNE
jgi:RND family efflux transporter MFP subunit